MTAATFETLVREHHRMVYAIAVSYVGPSAADDVCQEAYLQAYRSIDTLRDLAKARPWLFSLTRHAALNHLRSKRRQERADLRWAPRESTDPQAVAMVASVLDQIREDYRQILLLRYVEGMRYAEIAEALGMTVGAVGEKLSRVLDLVAERSRKMGGP